MFHSPLVTCSLDNPLQTNKESALDEKMHYSAGSVWVCLANIVLAMLLKNISRIFFSSRRALWSIGLLSQAMCSVSAIVMVIAG